MNGDFSFFLPISKVEKQKDGTCIVSGYASTQTRDLDGEIVSLDAIKKAWPGYWEWRNIREMHQPKAVGIGKEANIDDVGPFLRAKIVDPVAVQKCIEEVYKGFSIGGRKLAKSGDIITDLELVEVSLVDRPANPDCRINIAKRAKDNTEGAYLLKAKTSRDPKAKALTKMAQAVELMSKAGPPAAHDGFSLPAKPAESQSSPKDPEVQNNKASGACEEHGVVGCQDCMEKISDEARQTAEDKGKTQPGGGGKFPIRNKEDLDRARRAIGRSSTPGKTRSWIRTRAQALGVKLPPKWKKKRAMKLLKAAERSQKLLSLTSLSPAPTLPFLVLKGASVAEQDQERSIPALSSESSTRLRKGSKKIELLYPFHELLTPFNEDTMKTSAVSDGSEGLNSLDTAILNVIKRAAEPSRTKRMSMAQGNLKKARRARKTAQDSVKECHAALSKRFMAKFAKAGKKPADNDGDDDDMAETEKVLKGLQKAYSALTTMKTFIKAADSQLAKAVSRSGQRGTEVSDSSSSGTPTGAPPGLRDLSPGDMATAGGGSEPPMYPTDGGVYPGKLAKLADKNGMVPAAVAELMAENSRLEGQVSLLGKVPSTGPRPYAFDMSKVYGMDPNQTPDSRQKADVLFSGIDPTALQSQDENVRNKAAATVAGNYLMSNTFGKSIVDPNFRGKAGMGRGQ